MNKYDLWISGIMAWQNDYRKTQDIFVVKHQILKFHPLIDIKSIEASQFYLDNPNLMHPLESLGYASVGCVHCTSHGVGREGRWASVLGKTECGLHL